jgi:hypothetical protein
MTDTDEPGETGFEFLDWPDFPDEEGTEAPVESWLGALGQMAAALFAVVGIITLFIASAVVVRWLWP